MTNTPLELPAHLDLGQLIFDQAHDLRSPFNQVVGFSKVLLNDLSADPAPAARQEDLEAIYRSGQRALLLMNGLIDIARLNRREKELNPAEIEIRALLEQSLAYWRKFNPASNSAQVPDFNDGVTPLCGRTVAAANPVRVHHGRGAICRSARGSDAQRRRRARLVYSQSEQRREKGPALFAAGRADAGLCRPGDDRIAGR